MKYLDQLRAGLVSVDAIDDAIHAWHVGDGEEPLHEFLGMTFEEYAAWVEDPKVLQTIKGSPIPY